MIPLTTKINASIQEVFVLQFRVFFEHGPIEIVEAPSGEQARKVAGDLAKSRGTFVKKVKVLK